MEASEYSLKCAPKLQCEKNTAMAPLCQECQSCILKKKVTITKEWFLRASELLQRKFLLGIIRGTRRLDLLMYMEKVLQPVTEKDLTYTRTQTRRSLKEDLVASFSDKALEQNLLQQYMTDTWEWFQCGSYWTKANYTLHLFQMCSRRLLLSAANLVHVLIQDIQLCSGIVGTLGQPKRPEEMKFSSLAVSPNDPQKSVSGVSMYKDFISCLPVHLSKYILGFLNKKTLYNCLFVSQHWSYIAKDLLQDKEAEKRIQEDAKILQGISSKGLIVNYAKIRQVPIPKVSGDGHVIPSMKIGHHEIKTGQCLEASYTDLETLTVPMEERNLFCGSFSILVLMAQQDHHRVTHFDGERLVAVGSSDRKVRLIDTKERKQIAPLIHGHSGSIRAVHLCEKRGFVFSGSYDLSIRQWNVKTGACMRLFNGHMKSITCLDVQDNMLVSGAKDGQVKGWDITSGKCFRTFKHKDEILCVKIKGEYVVSGCENGLIKVWHVKSAALIKTLTGHQGPINCLSLDQFHLVSGSDDGKAIAWSMVGNCQKSLMTFNHPKEVTCLEFLYLRVITGCADGRVRIFHFLTGECMRVIRVNIRADPILSLCVRDNKMEINLEKNTMIFEFEKVSWDYSQDSGRVIIPKLKDTVTSPPLKTVSGRTMKKAQDKETKSVALGQKSSLLKSEEATLQQIKKWGQNSEERSARPRDAWGPGKHHQEPKRLIQRSQEPKTLVQTSQEPKRSVQLYGGPQKLVQISKEPKRAVRFHQEKKTFVELSKTKQQKALPPVSLCQPRKTPQKEFGSILSEKAEFRLRTVQQQQAYEAEVLAKYKRAEAEKQAMKERERKKAWLHMVKGKRTFDSIKEGKIVAPELGRNVFI
ncbi:F-box and WD repeat domain containing protein 10B-like [Rhinophrynus dorsalis]